MRVGILCLSLYLWLGLGYVAGQELDPLTDVNATLGDIAAREGLCSEYRLPAALTNTSFLGPYRSIVVGTVNYTYHRFGPLLSGRNFTRPLVLIPGSAATSKVWQGDFLAALATEREVITFDPRAFGSNDTAPVSQLTIDGIASSLVDFMAALSLSKPDVAGWSWGGYIALFLGAFYGDSIDNIVLFSTSSGGEGYFPGAAQDQLSVYDAQGQDVPHAALFPDTDDGNEALCIFEAFLQIMPGPTLSSDQILAQSELINSVFANNTLSEALGSIANTVLIGHGTNDVIIDIQSAEYLVALLPNAVLETTDAGHGFLFQSIKLALVSVTEFLDYYDYYDYYYDVPAPSSYDSSESPNSLDGITVASSNNPTGL